MSEKISLMDYNGEYNNQQKVDIAFLREVFKVAEAAVEQVAPVSRRRSASLTHLETALMFAVKAVAMGE